MSEQREVNESPLVQGADEVIVYELTTTPWGSAPGAVAVKAFEVTGGSYSDVSAAVTSGSAAVADDIITLPAIRSLTAGNLYRVEVQFTCGVNTFQAWLTIQAGNTVVKNAKLGDWDTRRLQVGEYLLGLVVVDNQARASQHCVVRVRVLPVVEETPGP